MVEVSISGALKSSRIFSPCVSLPRWINTEEGTDSEERANTVCGADPPAAKEQWEKGVTVSSVDGGVVLCSCMSKQLKPQQIIVGGEVVMFVYSCVLKKGVLFKEL